MYELVRTASRLLGDEFDIEIFDFHPWDKIDAPSGTALELAAYAAEGRGADTERHPGGGAARTRPASVGGAVSVSRRRAAVDVPGENSVFFAGPGQRLEIVSRVTDHRAFAGMSLEAAVWLAAQKPGFYGMDDMNGTAAS